MSAEIRLEGVSRRFGPGTPAADAVDLVVPEGSFYGLLGPSGSGKTTLLRLVAGFETADAGRILIGGAPAEALPPERRDLGVVFQSYALFPNMSVAENVGFGLRARNLGRAARRARVEEALALVRLEGLGGRRPHALSGGQRQRVALARALAVRPRALLLDEPLSALDRALRAEMQVELRRIQREAGVTTLFVTHDQEEALTLSDRIGLLRDGRLVQEGPPRDVYRRPRTAWAARFLGEATVFEGTPAPGGLTLPDGARIGWIDAAPGAALAAIRPEDVTLLRPSDPVPDGWNALDAELEVSIFSGPTATHRLRRGDLALAALTKGGEGPAAAPGDRLILAWPPERTAPLEG